jgi:hypothetical protein
MAAFVAKRNLDRDAPVKRHSVVPFQGILGANEVSRNVNVASHSAPPFDQKTAESRLAESSTTVVFLESELYIYILRQRK